MAQDRCRCHIDRQVLGYARPLLFAEGIDKFIAWTSLYAAIKKANKMIAHTYMSSTVRLSLAFGSL